MFFYIFHHINHYVFKPEDKSDTNTNARTLILGGIAYVILHGYLNSTAMQDYMFKKYFWWIFIIDFVAMGIIYKNYYGDLFFREVNTKDKSEEHIQMKKINKLSNNDNVNKVENDNKSYFKTEIDSVSEYSEASSRAPTVTSRRSRASTSDNSTSVDIDKMLEDTKSV